jgi:hypothetical protein
MNMPTQQTIALRLVLLNFANEMARASIQSAIAGKLLASRLISVTHPRRAIAGRLVDRLIEKLHHVCLIIPALALP